jgi:hypothetical protein
MSASPGPADQTFLAAERVVAILARAGIDSAPSCLRLRPSRREGIPVAAPTLERNKA